MSQDATGRIGFRLRGRIAEIFLARHAITPEDAIDFTPEARDARAFERLADKQIVRAAAPGRYWYDLRAALADAEVQRRRNVFLALAGTLFVITVALLFYRG